MFNRKTNTDTRFEFKFSHCWLLEHNTELKVKSLFSFSNLLHRVEVKKKKKRSICLYLCVNVCVADKDRERWSRSTWEDEDAEASTKWTEWGGEEDLEKQKQRRALFQIQKGIRQDVRALQVRKKRSEEVNRLLLALFSPLLLHHPFNMYCVTTSRNLLCTSSTSSPPAPQLHHQQTLFKISTVSSATALCLAVFVVFFFLSTFWLSLASVNKPGLVYVALVDETSKVF